MKRIAIILSLVVLVASCRKELSSLGSPNQAGNNGIVPVSKSTDMKVPAGFNFKTTNDIQVDIQLLSNSDQPIAHTTIQLFNDAPENGGSVLLTGSTNANGVLSAKLSVPLYMDELVINTSYLGIPRNIIVPVQQSKIAVRLGGSSPGYVRTVDVQSRFASHNLGKAPAKLSTRLGSWNSQGVPDYLTHTNDVASNQLVNDIWALLPSMQSVPQYHPELLDDNTTSRTILVTQTCDVWVTFVTEGAGFRNTLFYYKYPKNNPPTNASQIDSFYTVFPNSSFAGSGGGLQTGNKVCLGRFGPDTVIAYGIIADAFDINTATIGNGVWTFFANKELNPETNPALRQHMVLLYDANSSRLIMGFEDMKREAGGCDHDFNDVMFYTTSTPANAISHTNVAVLPASNDSDNDGVTDTDDQYPNDPARAFNNYYPSAGTMATVAFEDLWPYKGDFDMNDVVVDYRYKVVTNATNGVKDIDASYVLRASGGMIANSFAVEFPVSASNIASVSGASTQSGSSNLILKVINSTRQAMSEWNTFPTVRPCDSVNYHAVVTLTNPVALTSVGLSEYNPFIWGNDNGKNRGYEIHLPGKNWTGLADQNLFGTGHDDTHINGSKTYKTVDNLPFAINIPERFQYPVEMTDITTAYTKFSLWAQSGGTLFPDWYKNQSGYRNASLIYTVQ